MDKSPRTIAIEQLETLGLSSYAARTYVSLVSLGNGTAREVSQVSEVPRTRVYDAVEELNQRGLVDVQQSSPKQFWAISSETASRTFEREFQANIATLRSALEELEPTVEKTEQNGVWTVEGQKAVSDRVLEFIESADEEIVYMSVENLLTDEVIEALGEAAERGISVELGGVSPSVQERVQSDIPDASMFESLWLWSDTPAGRLLMIDREKTLVSVIVNGHDDDPDDPRSETAIWGEGPTNSLVVVLKAIFTWRLDELKE